MVEEAIEQKPFITINDVQLTVDELSEEGQAIFGRLQRLNQKKANLTLDLEEIQASINFFSSRIVELVNDEGDSTPTEEADEAETEE
jgi:FtsZ-binding cell division protein ZapB